MAANGSVKRLQEIFKQLPEDIKAPIRKATFEQAERLRLAMIFSVPQGETGELRASIRVEKSDRSNMRAIVKAGGELTTRDGFDYALAQEFGRTGQDAQPFFWPAYRSRKASMRKEIKAAAKKAIAAKVKIE